MTVITVSGVTEWGDLEICQKFCEPSYARVAERILGSTPPPRRPLRTRHLQKFLKTEVARVQSEVDNAVAGIKIIMEAIAPLRNLQISGTASRTVRSGPAANISVERLQRGL
jgi:hypothetical protein